MTAALMKRTASILTAILLSGSGLFAAAPKVEVDWASFLGRHDLVWEQLPRQWNEGTFVGNGQLGMMVYATLDDNRIDFHLGRLDVTDHRKAPDRKTSMGVRGANVMWDFPRLDLGRMAYDRVVSVMALHHWFPDVKTGLYRRIFEALKPGGRFVHGDYVVDAEESERMEALYHEAMSSSRASEATLHHLDIPLTLDKELELLDQAGFDGVQVRFETESAVVYIARKSG